MSDKETDDYYKNHGYHDRKPVYIDEKDGRPIKYIVEPEIIDMSQVNIHFPFSI